MSNSSASFGFKDVDASLKAGMVRGVFDRVAKNYDIMNDLMSGGVHRLWKDAVAARLNPQPGEVIIDCAGGTGDMARRFAKMARSAQERRGGPDATINIVDYNAEMIMAGIERGGEPEITWTVGDAQRLPLPDAYANAYVISFGIRNVTDIDAALREARRVLKPGGRFLCLEFSRPVTEALAKAYDAYSFKVIPQVGEWVAKDRDAYQYLVESIRRFPDQKTFAGMIENAGFKVIPQVGEWVAKDREAYQYLVESIRRFPDQRTFAGMMENAGFKRVTYTNFTGGVAALHQGWAL